ncbi:TadE/TadG family type IV pilus assembly protein [Sphingosinicella sp.]|uniref:TadE/TadG family type IV pilus assembly protein n=1 Tax=Sphingosinicella sp. TaxID=1917971 RepID=UPI0040378E9C
MLKWIARLRRTDSKAPGFLGRLRRDIRGNTLAIVGAALVPLTAMIGSGVDMSRAYMAKTRLQSACDAAALAARRVMSNDTLTQSVIDEGVRFFNFNFNQGVYGTATFTPAVTRPSAGTIRVTASTTIPTTIMRMFGFNTLPLDVTCDASLNFVNTDVLLVLDVTGSMDWDVNGNTTWVDANRRITALRDAVMALYDELAPIQTQLEANGLRLRYGVVPYSSTVNVGRLVSGAVPVPAGGGLPGNPDYLANSVAYQTRVGDYDDYTTVTNSDNTITETYGSSITQTQCNAYGVNQSWPTMNGQPAQTGGPPPNPVTQITYSYRDWGATGDRSGTTRTCRRYRRTVVTQSGYQNDQWIYRQETVDTSQYKMGTPVAIATDDGDDGGLTATAGEYDLREAAALAVGDDTTTVTWNGCIEERATTSVITGSSTNVIPNNAFDLDVNRIPNNDATRWRPMWPAIEWRRNGWSYSSMSGAACPAEARRLQAWTRTALLNYVNALDPGGSTYHDTGMIWGARMISNAGIFADSPNTFANMPVARHVIFMSDGQMDTDRNLYGMYGIESHDQRISGMTSPSETELNGRHMRRFQMMCEATKGLGASIWVIAFGTTLSAEMQACASNVNQASTISSRDALIARFREIGSNIGALRLTQ